MFIYFVQLFFVLVLGWCFWEDKSTKINSDNNVEALHRLVNYNNAKVAEGKYDEQLNYETAWIVRRNWFYRSKSFLDYINPIYHPLFKEEK